MTLLLVGWTVRQNQCNFCGGHFFSCRTVQHPSYLTSFHKIAILFFILSLGFIDGSDADVLMYNTLYYMLVLRAQVSPGNLPTAPTTAWRLKRPTAPSFTTWMSTLFAFALWGHSRAGREQVAAPCRSRHARGYHQIGLFHYKEERRSSWFW